MIACVVQRVRSPGEAQALLGEWRRWRNFLVASMAGEKVVGYFSCTEDGLLQAKAEEPTQSVPTVRHRDDRLAA